MTGVTPLPAVTKRRARSAAGRGRFVVVGHNQEYQSAIWTSNDGRNWRSADWVPTDDIELYDVVGGGPGFVAVGRSWGDDDHAGVAVAYVSSDGSAWRRVDVPAAGQQLRRIGRVGDRLVASNLNTLLVSDDGETWQLANAPVEIQYVLDFAEAGSGLLALANYGSGDDRPPTTTWFTEDGLDWQSDGNLPGAVSLASAVSASGRMGSVVIGTANTRKGDRWVAFRSSDGLSA